MRYHTKISTRNTKPTKAGGAQGTSRRSVSKSQPPGGKAVRKTAKSQATTHDVNPIRPDSKLGKMLAQLQRREGATIEQMMKVTGWQAHSVRGAMSGALKKRQGLAIAAAEIGNSRTYRIAVGGKASS